MKTCLIAIFGLVLGMLPVVCGENAAQITELDLKALEFELPISIRLRADMAALKRPEFHKRMKEWGLSADMINSDEQLESTLSVHRAWDGVVYLIDHSLMALWVRTNNDWKCIVAGLHIHKTMGGAPPRLPLRYLGGGYFAITETVPGDVLEKSERGFPQALAVTFLIDSNSGKVKERSESFVYDHTPTVKVPDSWIK